jgi:hypothetical protein
MTEENLAPVEPSVPGSADEPAPTNKDHVSYDTYRRTVNEAKNEREARRKLEAELAEVRKRDKAIEEQELAKKGEYEKLLQLREQENQTLKQQLDSYSTQFKRASKLNAFIKAAGTELDDKWLGLIDVDSIATRPDAENEIDQMSVQSAVETFRKTWPEAFKPKGSSIPADMPNGTGYITESEWKKLTKADEKRKYKQNQILWGK